MYAIGIMERNINTEIPVNIGPFPTASANSAPAKIPIPPSKNCPNCKHPIMAAAASGFFKIAKVMTPGIKNVSPNPVKVEKASKMAKC